MGVARLAFVDETLGITVDGVRRLGINFPSGDIAAGMQAMLEAPSTFGATGFINLPTVEPPEQPNDPGPNDSTGEERHLFQIARDGQLTVLEEGDERVFLLRAGGEGAEGVEALSTNTTTQLNVGDVIVDRSDVTFESLDLASWAVRWDEGPSSEVFLLPSVRVRVRAHTQLRRTLKLARARTPNAPCDSMSSPSDLAVARLDPLRRRRASLRGS